MSDMRTIRRRLGSIIAALVCIAALVAVARYAPDNAVLTGPVNPALLVMW